jgi:isoquinoline 1-oxidoreductase beta subunit
LGSFATVSCASSPSDFPKADALEPKGKKSAGKTFAPNAYMLVDPDGFVTVTICKSDMGQGVRTSLAMLAADEMDADWSKIRVIQAGMGTTAVSGQGTGGSSSIRGLHGQMRKIGAATRIMLVGAAAQQWGLNARDLRTEKGKVIAPDGRTLEYGELTEAAQSQPVPLDPKLKDPSKFTIVGKGASRIDNPDVVTGRAKYGIDSKVDGMVYAVIARPPTFQGSAKSFDDTEARKVQGVLDVKKFQNGVAVIGEHTWACLAGSRALKIEWETGPWESLNSDSILEKQKSALIAPMDMPAGAKTLEASFDLPFLAHATMEPMNALVDATGGKCKIWASTQVPDSAARTAAQVLGISENEVEVNVTLLGGGFGRRLSTDYIEEATALSKAVGKPVKLTWSREDDMKHDFYRAACHHNLKATLAADGSPLGWSHQAIQCGGQEPGGYSGAGLNYNVPHAGLRFGDVRTGVPTGAWRSVENTVLNVVNECFFDELAAAAGKDPYEYRRSLIKDDRLKAVLDLAAQKAGWGTPLPSGHGRGIACFAGYGSYVAHVVELSVSGDQIKLHKVVAAVDCGMGINPLGIEAIAQGGICDGLSTALRAEITIDKGGAVQNSWTDYQWMTMDAMPEVEVHRIENTANPGGMGEPPYPSVPPAVANAVFAATGKRVRKFPIRVSELV